MKIIFLLFLCYVSSFKHFPSIKLSNKLFMNRNNNETVPDVIILPFNFSNVIENYDDYVINNVLKDIPKEPETEDEIEDDSFEGYLKSEFIFLRSYREKIHFQTFYVWKKGKGLVLTKQEVKDIYNSVSTDEFCDLMQFIKINKIIDECNCGHL